MSDVARKTNVLGVWETLKELVEDVLFVNGLWIAHHHPPPKGTLHKCTTVQFVTRHGLASV